MSIRLLVWEKDEKDSKKEELSWYEGNVGNCIALDCRWKFKATSAETAELFLVETTDERDTVVPPAMRQKRKRDEDATRPLAVKFVRQTTTHRVSPGKIYDAGPHKLFWAPSVETVVSTPELAVE